MFLLHYFKGFPHVYDSYGAPVSFQSLLFFKLLPLLERCSSKATAYLCTPRSAISKIISQSQNNKNEFTHPTLEL